MNIRLSFVFFIFFSLLTFGQKTTNIPLPEDVKHGKLANGMTYYIMHNEEPKERVSFYFAQNVGAILEEDDEDGLAHFLEHMAFNGSKNFPDRSMDKYLESKGLLFGRDFNAYTSTDETMYTIDNVPANDTELVDKCLLILHDWSGSLLLKGKDIDEERGVIEEEWRSGRSPQTRIREKTLPVMYAGSRYAERDVIGDQKFIQSFEHESLRNYYKKWYRPDLQAVIVVGDIDVEEMESKVKALFSQIPLRSDAPKRPYYDVPDNEEPAYLLATEKGVTSASLQWLFKVRSPSLKDTVYLRTQLVYDLFRAMVNGRYDEIVQEPSAASTLIDAGWYTMELNQDAFYLETSPKLGREQEAIREAYTEIERIQRFGFLMSELEREKKNLVTYYENNIEDEITRRSGSWANALSGHFFRGEPVKKAAWSLAFLTKTLPTITLDEMQSVSENFGHTTNSLIILSGPEDEKADYPSKKNFLQLIDEVKKSDLETYQDNTNDGPLITKELEIRPVRETFEIPHLKEAKGFILANGAKVIFNPSKKKGDDVTMNAMSWGGLSLVNEEELADAEFIVNLTAVSGLGAFDKTQLTKKLAGRTAEVQLFLEEYREEIEGFSKERDMELLLQLVYLHFEAPNFDKDVFEAQRAVNKERLVQFAQDERKAFYDSLNVAIVNRHKRGMAITAQDMDKVDYATSTAIYSDRFSDADDFVFLFTGNFDFDEALPLAQKYLGNISSLPKKEIWKDNGAKPKNGALSIHFEKEMATPQSSIFYGHSAEVPYSLENELMFKVIKSILDTRYIDTVREEEGGSYGVRVATQIRRVPEERMVLFTIFNCNPAKQSHLIEIVKEEITTLHTNGPLPLYVEKAKKNLIKDREEQLREDAFWQQEIKTYMMHGDAPISNEQYTKSVNGITPEAIQEFAKKFLKDSDTFEVVMNPK